MEKSDGDSVRVIKTTSKPSRAPLEKFPWPRQSSDDPSVDLGVDVEAKFQDITKIVHKYFKVAGVSMEELLQEVFVAIIHKNYTRSAHDPRKSSFGHYVYMIANNVCINLVHKKKKYSKEHQSLDAPNGADDSRSLLDIIDSSVCEEMEDQMFDIMRNAEEIMRKQGHRDLARYIRSVRSGASPDVIREALSWGDQKMSNKNIRDFRIRIRMTMQEQINF